MENCEQEMLQGTRLIHECYRQNGVALESFVSAVCHKRGEQSKGACSNCSFPLMLERERALSGAPKNECFFDFTERPREHFQGVVTMVDSLTHLSTLCFYGIVDSQP